MSRTLYLLFFATILLNSCEEKKSTVSSNADTIRITDTISKIVLRSDSIKPVCKDTLTLFEHSLDNMPIPFTGNDIRARLENAFPDYRLRRDLEFDPQDGGTFLVYTLYTGDAIAAEIYMQENDTLTLGKIESSGPFFKDQYGIKVGDSFGKVTDGKAGEYTVHHNPYAASYIEFNNSNIYYEIEGSTQANENPIAPSEPVDPEMKDWKVTKIVWYQQ